MQRPMAMPEFQYSPRLNRVERFNIAGRYQPEIDKVLSAGYRFTPRPAKANGLSASGPVLCGWHAVGRFSYSTRDRRMVASQWPGWSTAAAVWVRPRRLPAPGGAWPTLQHGAVRQLRKLNPGLNQRSGIQNPTEILKRNVPGYGDLISSAVLLWFATPIRFLVCRCLTIWRARPYPIPACAGEVLIMLRSSIDRNHNLDSDCVLCRYRGRHCSRTCQLCAMCSKQLLERMISDRYLQLVCAGYRTPRFRRRARRVRPPKQTGCRSRFPLDTQALTSCLGSCRNSPAIYFQLRDPQVKGGS